MESVLTVPVQMLFTSLTSDGLVLDCTVAEEVVTSSDRRIPPGSPFSLLIDHDGSDPDGADPGAAGARRLLERWCSSGVVVEATTSTADRFLVLRHDEDRLVLEIV